MLLFSLYMYIILKSCHIISVYADSPIWSSAKKKRVVSLSSCMVWRPLLGYCMKTGARLHGLQNVSLSTSIHAGMVYLRGDFKKTV